MGKDTTGVAPIVEPPVDFEDIEISGEVAFAQSLILEVISTIVRSTVMGPSLVGVASRFFSDFFQIVAAVGRCGLGHLQQGCDDLFGCASFRLFEQELGIGLLFLADLIRLGELGVQIPAEQFGVALFNLRPARDRLPLGLDSGLG